MTYITRIRRIPWGEARTGAWCDRCALPSAVEQDIVYSGDRATLGRRVAVYCSECDRYSTRSPE